MPRLAGLGLSEPSAICTLALSSIKFAPDVGVLRLIGGNIGDLCNVAVGAVDLLFVPFERLDHVTHGTCAEEASKERDLAHAPTWTLAGGHLLAQAEELRLPDGGVAALTCGDALKGASPRRILLDLGEGVVQEDCVAL